jgi:hypothetical protein
MGLMFSSLYLAAQQGHLPLVDLLIIRGADLNLANIEGAIPMIMATVKVHLEVIKFLVEKGAVVDEPHNNGKTAHSSSMQGYNIFSSNQLPGVVKLILESLESRVRCQGPEGEEEYPLDEPRYEVGRLLQDGKWAEIFVEHVYVTYFCEYEEGQGDDEYCKEEGVFAEVEIVAPKSDENGLT